MDAIEAGYHFAGVCGIAPVGYTLRQLWMLADGKLGAQRQSNLDVAYLVWGMAEIDIESYLQYGEMSETGKGGPVELTPELQWRLEQEVARIRAENPGLPTVKRRE